LIEDNLPIRKALQRILARVGYVVEAVGTIAEGFGKLDGQNCMLLDINLPDGLSTNLLQHVRRNGLPIRVAVMSACTDAGQLAELAQMKPDAFFQKPLALEDVLEWLEVAAGRTGAAAPPRDAHSG
jgi:DNA-binding response OmpR family regulator